MPHAGPERPIATGGERHPEEAEMKARRFGITIVAVASIAAAVGAGIAQTGGSPDWLAALNARSEALNEEHRLGDHAQRRVLGAPGTGGAKRSSPAATR